MFFNPEDNFWGDYMSSNNKDKINKKNGNLNEEPITVNDIDEEILKEDNIGETKKYDIKDEIQKVLDEKAKEKTEDKITEEVEDKVTEEVNKEVEKDEIKEIEIDKKEIEEITEEKKEENTDEISSEEIEEVEKEDIKEENILEEIDDIQGESLEGKPKKRFSKTKAIIIALAAVYLVGVFTFSRITYANTSINGKDASFKPVKNTFTEVELAPIAIKCRDNVKYSVYPNDAGMEIVDKELGDIKQNSFIWPIEFFKEKAYKLDIEKSVDKDKLKTWIENSDLNKEVIEPENAKIEKNNSNYEIIEEVMGNKLDNEKVSEILANAFLEGDKEVDLEEAYINPEITKDSLEERKIALDKLKDCEIIIDLDGKEEKLDDLQDFLNDETLEIDRGKLQKYVGEIKNKYDNQGAERDFTTSSGQNIKISGGIFGNRIHRDKTVDKIIEALENGESARIEPVYTHKSINGGNIGNTYIEISIGRQYMWFYKDGQLIVETPVVTGTANGRHDTPRGVYEAWLMESNRFLIGNNDDGSKYKVPVKYWIQLDYTGVGIHDTYYRGSYGGNIYKYNGSHGCINTPLGNVSKIYSNLEKGTPTIIY